MAVEKRLEAIAQSIVEQDALGPAFAGAQHIAVGKTATGHQAPEIPEIEAPRIQVAHMHIDGAEAGPVEGGGHLNVAVHALLAQYRAAARWRYRAPRRPRRDRSSVPR